MVESSGTVTIPSCLHAARRSWWHAATGWWRTAAVAGPPQYTFRAIASAKLLKVATKGDDEDIPGIDRLLALTDGVVAIALTLLVLQLQVPVTHALKENPDSAGALWHALSPDASEITSYLVSFLVIAQFWMVHHRVLQGMRGHSEGLAWRNFGFLLALTLMPFTSDLIGRYGTNPVAITLFGLNLVAISLTTQWIFLYAAHHDLIKDGARSARDERIARVRVIYVLGIVAISLALGWRAPQLAKFVWLLFLVVSPLAERTARVLDRRRPLPQVPDEESSGARSG
jgi:uncharacterized membrane protein